jgi:hypothetical protein
VLFDIFYKRLAACYNGQVPVSTDFGAEWINEVFLTHKLPFPSILTPYFIYPSYLKFWKLKLKEMSWGKIYYV